jgi:mannose-6-phosphate isomerase-like protein (cupin superfamily)
MKFGKVVLAPSGRMKAHSNGGSEELLIILEGLAVVSFSGRSISISSGDAVVIPKGTVHSVENLEKTELKYYYVLPNKN